MPTEQSAGGTVHECPEYCCGLSFNTSDELQAHLEWDHNRSEYKAKEMIDDG
ncbi:hypothetical protein [Halosolutus gelatinilyticus]|uniref:hypothetical protein n=1 Tax=Halosolutus gelatinilyticus TaxID=2931975 RepID=UPI001FF60DCA|nr:hypothetical protein [Halosolutus gelatinilyticus]